MKYRIAELSNGAFKIDQFVESKRSWFSKIFHKGSWVPYYHDLFTSKYSIFETMEEAEKLINNLIKTDKEIEKYQKAKQIEGIEIENGFSVKTIIREYE